jgi:hypothetical protein
LAAVALVAIAIVSGSVSMIDPAPDVRSVQPLSLAPSTAPERFDPSQSAALFVGVREFDASDVSLVQYAVDDAVDLAYAFTFNGRSHLVEPERVVLALSGEPQKPESRERLKKLLASGVTRISPTAEELQSALEQQTDLVMGGGLLLVSFATHGFVDRDGTHYLLGSGSTFEAETSLSASQVLDVASRAPRSLVLVDACRERVPSGSRAGDSGPRSTAPSIKGRTPAAGQVVFYAAPPGGYAFDDHDSGNGIFTKATLEGLACKGSGTRINVDQLHRYVEERVRKWVERERPGATGGVQVNIEGRSRLMLLANCNCESQPPPGDTWRERLAAPTRWEVADLDGDCTNETVVQAGGTLYAFDAKGRQLWSAGEGIREFSISTAYDDERDVLALSMKGFMLLDHAGKTLSSVLGDLRDVRLYRPNGNHMNRIVAIAGDTVMLFKRNKSTPEWRLRLPGLIQSLDILDHDKNRRLDLLFRTTEGRVVLDVAGHSLNGARFEKLPRK